jgi:hypothetical protein
MKTTLAFAVSAGRKIAKAGCGLARFTSHVDNAKTEAHRAVRRTCRAGQDFVDDVTFAIKKKPLESIGVALGLGLGVGTVAGWLGTKRR